ncbi:MAG: hypothetical protein Phog2KO_40420 [Phototrophicaceae bacterium]
MNENVKTYLKNFSLTMVAYSVLLIVSRLLLNAEIENQALRIVIAVLPVLPVPFGVWVIMTFVRTMDELQRRIQFEAVAFSMLMTGMITFTLGFLADVGVPQLGLIWVFPMSIALWGIGQFLASRRYQ